MSFASGNPSSDALICHLAHVQHLRQTFACQCMLGPTSAGQAQLTGCLQLRRPCPVTLRSLEGQPLESRRRTASAFQRYATLSAATHRLLEPELSQERRDQALQLVSDTMAVNGHLTGEPQAARDGVAVHRFLAACDKAARLVVLYPHCPPLRYVCTGTSYGAYTERWSSRGA
jgi:hypothetical protein